LVLRTHPDLRSCLCRCRECRIFFLTHPRNAGRRDLRCPFGCRAAHRRQGSTERSREYYQSKVGKVKKRALNSKRGRGTGRHRRPGERKGMSFDADVVRYLVMVVTLIEGRRVREEEIRKMLARAVRQHRIARRRRIDYLLHYLQKNRLEAG
jgi:hypothetical protein